MMSNYPADEDIVADWGFEIVATETFGSYQGDLLFTLRDGERIGYVVIGYGSCSGCDALEAIWYYSNESPWREHEGIKSLSAELLQGVRWFDNAEAFRAGVAETLVRGTDWYIYDDDARDWLARQALAVA